MGKMVLPTEKPLYSSLPGVKPTKKKHPHQNSEHLYSTILAIPLVITLQNENSVH